MQYFYVFQKINLLNFSITWNKINNSSDLLVSYPSITQTQMKLVLPTSFKFRVNSYIKIVVSKTWENSRLKTRYLKGITIEQLFISFIIRDYLQSPFLFYLAPKNKLKQTRHTLFILFSVIHLFFLIYIRKLRIIKGKEILIQIHRGCLLPQAGCYRGCSTRWSDLEVLEQVPPHSQF